MPIDITNTTQTNNTLKNKGLTEKSLKVVSGNSTASSQADKQVKTPGAADSVQLTDSASRIKQLEDKIAQLPIVDTEKVEQIQQAISEGRYEINADRIAQKLLGLEQDFRR